MKRIRPKRKVLIKRERPQLKEYDYIYVDSGQIEHLFSANIRNPSSSTIFKKAGLIAKIEYKIKHYSKTGLIERFILLIIGSMLTIIGMYVYDHWIKTETNKPNKIENTK